MRAGWFMNVISLVDDDASVRSATVDLLDSLGFACEAYASAEEYLAERIVHTSCLILDVNLPGLNGLELQRHLVQSGRTVPIIFITAFPEERARAEAIRAGAVCCLLKPYSDEELLTCIHRALGLSRST
jgi:FixJ family two-component response regulator